MMQTITFNGVLETIEALSIEDQIALLEVMQHRLVDSRRTEIANNILKAKAAYQEGSLFRGTVDEAIAELNNWGALPLIRPLSGHTSHWSGNVLTLNWKSNRFCIFYQPMLSSRHSKPISWRGGWLVRGLALSNMIVELCLILWSSRKMGKRTFYWLILAVMMKSIKRRWSDFFETLEIRMGEHDDSGDWRLYPF
jgi:hypothetical protein